MTDKLAPVTRLFPDAPVVQAAPEFAVIIVYPDYEDSVWKTDSYGPFDSFEVAESWAGALPTFNDDIQVNIVPLRKAYVGLHFNG